MLTDKHHLINHIKETEDSYILQCVTSHSQYEQISKILCQGTDTICCDYEKINVLEGSTVYKVNIPRPLEKNIVFFVHQKNGSKKRVWRPALDLSCASIPKGFYFTNRYMYLMYDADKTLTTWNIGTDHFEAVLTKISQINKQIYLSGFLFLPLTFSGSNRLELEIISTNPNGKKLSFPLSIRSDTDKFFNHHSAFEFKKFNNRVMVCFECRINPVDIKKLKENLEMFVNYNGVQRSLLNFNPKLADGNHCYTIEFSLLQRVLFVPFYYEAGKIWRLDIYHMNLWDGLRLSLLSRKCRKNQIKKDDNTWLIGDRIYSADDNGMHFFHYLQTHHPEINAYYVISPDSDYLDTKNDKNIIKYGSYKHFQIAGKAGTLVFSQIPDYLLPKLDTIVQYRNNNEKFNTFFLQHGVIATTTIVMFYRKQLRKFNRFVVSSKLEKENIIKHLGYNEEEVVVTGLPRWDLLHNKHQTTMDILVMPTWRNNLRKVRKNDFINSGYFQFWNGLLTNSQLLDLLKKNNIMINFHPHTEMSKFNDCFTFSPPVNETKRGEKIQQLLLKCRMLVTDYSSVAFDVLYQNKPVLFCPFDLEEMQSLRKGPQFINYEKDLPGPICYNIPSTVKGIKDYIESGYNLTKNNKQRVAKFFAHIDSNNCERVYNEIHSYLNPSPIMPENGNSRNKSQNI